MLLEAFPARVAALGSALGIDERLRGVFTEAEIRAGVVFQLSKLATLLCRAARTASGSSSWDVVVSGQAKGRLVEVDSFDPLAVAELASREDIVLLVKCAADPCASLGDLRGGGRWSTSRRQLNLEVNGVEE